MNTHEMSGATQRLGAAASDSHHVSDTAQIFARVNNYD